MKLRFHLIHLIVALFGACAVALSQDAGTTGRPVFIAADVHPSPPGLTMLAHLTRAVGPVMASGLFQMRNATILDMISLAYGIDRHKVIGGPRSLDWDRFDINAVAPADASAESQKAMLRALLADRFKLVSHAGSQPVNMWVLSASAKPKIAGANADDGSCQIERSVSVALRQSGDANDSWTAPLQTLAASM
jgi:uncharacterized protein (TIGR03435 family)